MYVKVEGFAPESSLCTALAQGGASIFWGNIWYFQTRHSLGEKGSQYVGKNTFGTLNSWLALLPFAVGAFSLYILNMLALDYMSPASFTAVYMSKLVVDMLFGWVLFGSRISLEAMLAVSVIGVNTVVHVQTLGPSESNTDPVLGCIWTFAYVMSAAVSCTYLSWLSKHQSYPAVLLMFISSVEQSIGGLILYILTRAGSGTMAGAFDTLQQGEIWLLVVMIAIADAGYFFACILFSSQGLTLITALMIPLGYGFEMLALDGDFDLVPAISGLCIGVGVIQKVRIHEADNSEEAHAPTTEAQKEDAAAGTGGKVDEKESF
jgi:drug/metabolite transporter (DMT)-like permease